MDNINFTNTEKDHIGWLVNQHKLQVLDMYKDTEDEKECEILNVALKVDRDICEKLWQDKEKQNKIAEAKFKSERAKR